MSAEDRELAISVLIMGIVCVALGAAAWLMLIG
jgi:hypothetical protein